MSTSPGPKDLFSSDATFDSLYSLRARQLSLMHWTPLNIAKKAAEYLTAGSGTAILDIGSGVGKFCLVAAHYFPAHFFYGVEQRKALIDEAIIAQNATSMCNVKFIHANFTELDMDQYDHFYFYNSFSENIVHYKPIDNLIQTSAEIYDEYLSQFYELLENKPAGTRLATFHCSDGDVPPAYKRSGYTTGEPLSLWIKQ
ncbi:class I SAM-dependent methyltransferase [Pedobacter hartonius]|uniref:Methyltransferase domain-containing protein n=1 Tax=Pedobacter hartonius TaxID=425514 RepID=A0A1H4FMP2_9SPHI|nr:class I SAM-dependent methyltransferase [Pedobacter hartonius]SEA98643.1 Methyltransferase domain-containing protein [Pedobacter hartonius]